MAGKQSLYEKQLQRIIDSMGVDLLKKMTPEERMRGLTVSERLAGLDIEDLRTLDPEEKAALLRLLDQPDKTQN
ncbi:YaaA family protein [Candidatus Poribacteria bacterium]|nr:YaaA family protein [Candidatus Poribacteria bacterium]MYK24099.1 YaaA family protein [Candidatus Poribacteria bacterium]